LDRLTHRCHILEATGESYRLQDARRRRAAGKKTNGSRAQKGENLLYGRSTLTRRCETGEGSRGPPALQDNPPSAGYTARTTSGDGSFNRPNSGNSLSKYFSPVRSCSRISGCSLSAIFPSGHNGSGEHCFRDGADCVPNGIGTLQLRAQIARCNERIRL
jgi:hypothetical protein